MLNGRLYRAAFLPFLLALALAAFSLGGRPPALTSTLAPDAFQGTRAFAELRSLLVNYPRRRPGSGADERMARAIAASLRALGGTAGGGFTVHVRHLEGQTIDGEKGLTTVIAERPGSTSESPILIVAHRDAAAPGSAAELSGTAALLELARVFAARETKRTIVLASTSGGSGGNTGAGELPSSLVSAGIHGPFDAAIVLGDLAAYRARRPFVVPYSDAFGSAPLALQRTVAQAIKGEAGWDPGAPSTLGQLAHLMFPMAVGEQGVLNAQGLPAVLVQATSERGPAPAAKVSMERLEGLGRAVLNSVDALDAAPDVSHAPQTGLLLQRKTMPEWALASSSARSCYRPWLPGRTAWRACAAGASPSGAGRSGPSASPFPSSACALLCWLLGQLGIIGAAPSVPVPPRSMPFDAAAGTTVAVVGLTFVLAWLLWGVLLRRAGLPGRPDPEVAGLPIVLILTGLGALAWLINPYSALLLLRRDASLAAPGGPRAAAQAALRRGPGGPRPAASDPADRLLRPPARDGPRRGRMGSRPAARGWTHRARLGGPLESRARLCHGGNAAGRPGSGRPDAAELGRRRGDDPRAHVLRGTRIARGYRVGSATIGSCGRLSRHDHHASARIGAPA